MFYKDYSINERLVPRALLLYYARQVRALLPATKSWVDSPFYDSLTKAMKKKKDSERIAEAWVLHRDSPAVRQAIVDGKRVFPDYVSGKKKIVHRVQKEVKADTGTGVSCGVVFGRGNTDIGPPAEVYQALPSKSRGGGGLKGPAVPALEDWQMHRDPAIISGNTPEPSDDEEYESDVQYGRDGKRIPRRIQN